LRWRISRRKHGQDEGEYALFITGLAINTEYLIVAGLSYAGWMFLRASAVPRRRLLCTHDN
jgi:hypothetical protein